MRSSHVWIFCFNCIQHLWTTYELTRLRAPCSGKPSESEGATQVAPSRKSLPKTGLFFESIFVLKGSHRHLSAGSPARHLISARTRRATSETIPLESGWVQIKTWAFGWLLCLFPTQVSFILVCLFLQGTLCAHHTYSPSSQNTNPGSFLKDEWLRACPVFLFSSSYSIPMPTKMSVFIYF